MTPYCLDLKILTRVDTKRIQRLRENLRHIIRIPMHNAKIHQRNIGIAMRDRAQARMGG